MADGADHAQNVAVSDTDFSIKNAKMLQLGTYATFV